MTTLLVAGSRGFHTWRQDAMSHVLSNASYTFDRIIDEVIHGGASGVDVMAGTWATERGYPVQVFPAQWEKYGKSAGYRRNAEMVAIANLAIVVWDGDSRGTAHTIDLLRKERIPHIIVTEYL